MVDVDLSREEDSVSSLAVAHSDERSATVFAGINSSSKAQENEHLRSFRLGYPPKRKSEEVEAEEAEDTAQVPVQTEPLSKTSLFSSSKSKETYQRILRLSRPNPSTFKRLGAAATGLAPEGELVIFDGSRSRPSESDIRERIKLENGAEVADVDIIEDEEGDYMVAYCTDYEIFMCKVPADSSANTKAPYSLHEEPHPDFFAGKARPTYRSLRFLTPTLLLLLRNKPNRTGAELLLLDVPAARIPGTIVLRKNLHRGIKAGTALAATTLRAPLPSQNVQHVVAVAGADVSLTTLTLDHDPARGTRRGGLALQPHSFHAAAHPLQITALALSHFEPPRDRQRAPAQYLKLASASMAQTVLVHTFPLTPYPAKSSKTPARYTLRFPGAKSEAAQTAISVFFALLMVAIGAFGLQAFTEIRGGTPEYMGAKDWLPDRVRDWIALPYMFAETGRPEGTSKMPVLMEEILGKIQEGTKGWKGEASKAEEVNKGDDKKRKSLLIKEGENGVEAQVAHHDDDVLEGARKWEELGHEERETWKEKLIEAGTWTAEKGESVLKGTSVEPAALVHPNALHCNNRLTLM